MKKRPPRVRYASLAALAPPEKAMKMTMSPATTKGPRKKRICIARGTIPAAPPELQPLGGVRRGAPGALPAAVGGEDVAERRQAVVVAGVLLVVDHQEALGPRADLLGHDADRLADVRLGGGAVAAGALRLVGEDTRRASAGARLRLGGRPCATRAHEQPAVRAAERLLGPLLADLPLYEEMTMRAVAVGFCPALLARYRCQFGGPLVFVFSPRVGQMKPIKSGLAGKGEGFGHCANRKPPPGRGL